METLIIKDILLQVEPLGLADKLLTPTEALIITVSSDELPENIENKDAEVFFGVELPIGDIGEIKGRVLSYEKNEEGLFNITVQVLGLDNRYTSFLTQILKGERDLDNKNRPIWGLGIKQTNGAFATLINCPAGLLNAKQLAKIAEITKNGYGLAKITHAMRLVLLVKAEQLETIQEELHSVGLNIGVLHYGIRNIRGCCGALCDLAQKLDGLDMALQIDKAFFGVATKFDLKIAISDCSRNCMESFCVDIGLVGNKNAYDIYVGGISSAVHYKALKLTAGVAPKNIIFTLKKIIEWYENTAQHGERFYKTLERLGKSESDLRKKLFTSTAEIFSSLDIGDDIYSRLENTLARGKGVLKMRQDLKF